MAIYLPLDDALREYGLNQKPRGLPTVQCVDMDALASCLSTQKEYVSIPEAARIIQRATSQIYNQFIPSGSLQPVYIGGRRYLKRSEVNALRDRLNPGQETQIDYDDAEE